MGQAVIGGSAQDERYRANNASTPERATLFQPAIMVRSILADDDPADAGEAGAAAPRSGTEVLAASTSVDEAPASVCAYFLIVDAASDQERRPLLSATTVVGREGDVAIDDPTASKRHFKVEEMSGPEFYIRDLDSRNGTYLNGRKIHYCHLLPGDEVRIGTTVLMFHVTTA